MSPFHITPPKERFLQGPQLSGTVFAPKVGCPSALARNGRAIPAAQSSNSRSLPWSASERRACGASFLEGALFGLISRGTKGTPAILGASKKTHTLHPVMESFATFGFASLRKPWTCLGPVQSQTLHCLVHLDLAINSPPPTKKKKEKGGLLLERPHAGHGNGSGAGGRTWNAIFSSGGAEGCTWHRHSHQLSHVSSCLSHLPSPAGPFKLKLIFQVPPHRCHVSRREGTSFFWGFGWVLLLAVAPRLKEPPRPPQQPAAPPETNTERVECLNRLARPNSKLVLRHLPTLLSEVSKREKARRLLA